MLTSFYRQSRETLGIFGGLLKNKPCLEIRQGASSYNLVLRTSFHVLGLCFGVAGQALESCISAFISVHLQINRLIGGHTLNHLLRLVFPAQYRLRRLIW